MRSSFLRSFVRNPRCTKTHLVHVTGFTLGYIMSSILVVVRVRPSLKNRRNWPFPFSRRVPSHNTFQGALRKCFLHCYCGKSLPMMHIFDRCIKKLYYTVCTIKHIHIYFSLISLLSLRKEKLDNVMSSIK